MARLLRAVGVVPYLVLIAGIAGTGRASAAASAAAAPTCPPLTPAGLAGLTKKQGGPWTLVFFASWCSSCREHLVAKHDGHTLLIGSFDKVDRVEAVMAALKPDAPCFLDDGITQALGVDSLPMTVTLPGAPPAPPAPLPATAPPSVTGRRG